MDEERPLSDDALDRAIREALAVDPSPRFLARVRERIEAERAGPMWWRRHELALAGGAILLAIAVWSTADRGVLQPAPVSVPKPAPAPRAAAIEPLPDLQPAPSAERRAPAAASGPAATRDTAARPPATPGADADPFDHILLAENERNALRWFGAATRVEPPEPAAITTSAPRAAGTRPALSPVSFDGPEMGSPVFEAVSLDLTEGERP